MKYLKKQKERVDSHLQNYYSVYVNTYELFYSEKISN